MQGDSFSSFEKYAIGTQFEASFEQIDWLT